MNTFEELEEFEEPDQTTTGWEPTPLPADHFSLSPEWKKYKASLVEPEHSAAAADAPSKDWYQHAASLAGCSTEES